MEGEGEERGGEGRRGEERRGEEGKRIRTRAGGKRKKREVYSVV